MTQFAESIIYDIYFHHNDKIYIIRENSDWTQLQPDHYEELLNKNKESGQKYMVIYNHIILNKIDHWEANPENIKKDELDFWYLYGILEEEKYLLFVNMITD